MDTRLLRSFVATVRHGSVTVAAAELSYVQSTVTAHIQALERLTDARLLDRLPLGVRATTVGASWRSARGNSSSWKSGCSPWSP